jgi:ketosteroid isomerase-like protein
MMAAKNETGGEAQIRALVDGWAKATRAKDVGGRTANYTPDVLMFDVVNPLQFRGPRRSERDWLSGFLRSRAHSASRCAI